MRYEQLTLESLKTEALANPLDIGWEALDEGGDTARFELLNAYQIMKQQIPRLELEFTKFKKEGVSTMDPEVVVEELVAAYLLEDVTTRYFSILDVLVP